MKKILLITDFFRPEPGGLEGFFTGIVEQWPADSIEVIVTRDYDHYFSRQTEIRRFDERCRFPLYRFHPRPGRMIGNRQRDFARFLRERILDSAPRHILLGNLHHYAATTIQVAREMGLPWSIFVNGTDLQLQLTRRGPARKLLSDAHHIFLISRHLTRQILDLNVSEEQLVLLNPAVDPSRLLDARPRRRRGLQLPEALQGRFEVGQERLLLAIGPLLPRKGFDVAIEVMMQLRFLHPPIRLALVGSGPELVYLQELVHRRQLEEHILFTGYLKDEELATLMELSELLIHPGSSRRDDQATLHATILEALHFGLPVVAGDLGSVGEIIESGQTGELFEVGNVDSLFRATESLLANLQQRRLYSKNGQQAARKEFRFSRAVTAIGEAI